MRKLYASVVIVTATFVTACSGQSSLTAPAPLTAASAHQKLTAPTVSDACKPPTSSVVFDESQLGHVIVTNNSTCTNDFLYIVWSVSPSDEADQALVAATGARLAPGETRHLTLGFPEACGTKYQRDVYLGLSDEKVRYTYAEMGNYFFAALGAYQYAPRCDTPSDPPSHSVTPPVDVCPNLEGMQASVPSGFTLVGGACVPADNTPSDVCPNVPGIQLTVPAGYSLVGGQCVAAPPPPAQCTDATATNFGGAAPCVYLPPTLSCGPFTFSGPISADVPNGAPGRLAYARSFGSAYANVVAVQPSHGNNFTNNNNTTFTFTPSENYAVVIFHHSQGGRNAVDIVYTGVTAGQSFDVPTDGGDVFYFNCPQ